MKYSIINVDRKCVWYNIHLSRILFSDTKKMTILELFKFPFASFSEVNCQKPRYLCLNCFDVDKLIDNLIKTN